MIRLPHIALLAAALLAACSNVQPERPTGEVRGKATLHGLDDSSGIVVSLAGPRSASARTNAKGEYLVTDLPPGQYTLTVSADDVLERALETQVSVTQDVLANAPPLELTPTGKLSGRVTLGSDTGNAGVTVVVPGSGTSVTTGDAGTFLLERVPVGAHDVVAFYPGRQTASWKAVSIERGKEAQVAAATLLPVAPAPGLIRGRALLAGEESSAGVLVSAIGPVLESAVSDASGHYQLQGLPDGVYALTLVAPSTAEGSQSVTVTVAGGPIDAANVTFTAQGAVSGTVQLEGSEAQSDGVLVSVNGTQITALTDAAGGFLLRGVPTGKRTLSFSRAGWDSRQLADVQVQWAKTVQAQAVTLAKARPLPGAITGKVVLQGEQTHANVLVTIAGLVTQSQLTDDTGSYAFQHLPDGAYSVTAQAASTVEGQKSQVVAVAGEPSITPDFSFTPVGQLTGKVTLQGLASPALRGVRIQVSGTTQPVYTEADGTFSMRGVPTGAHDVTATMAGFDAQTASQVVALYGQTVTVADLALTDVNECATNNGGCDPNATCGNTPGSRTCACNQGYAGNGQFCQDVNECLTNNGGCDPHATCQNTDGGHTCSCNDGYTGTGTACSDVNECATDNGGCDANATCTNTQGGRTCSCKQGYAGDGITCSDVNECLVNNGGCSLDATCQNGQGSFSCTCKQGFTGDGVTCQDVNECLVNNGGCSQNATCTNTVGSRQCACLSGFDGDGLTCKPRWMSVAAGAAHSFGIREDGTLWGWGTNAQNTLGDGSGQTQLSPVRIAQAGLTWLQAATSGTSSCAVRSDASLWCWGDNLSGQVGDGSTTLRSTPVRVGVDNNWSSVAVGTQNACAIRQNGTLWCWGDNASGQLGQGNTSASRTPLQVGTDVWVKVSLQTTSVCGIKVDGSLWCWGNGANLQQSGVATTPQRLGTTNDFVQLAHSSGHLCAVRGLATGGTLWCLGSNSSGQLGNGTFVAQSSFVQVGSASDWTAVDAGALHTCARRANGTLWCWGTNADAQLGVAAATTSYALSPRQVGAATDWKSVVNVGDRHSCAQKLDGSSWCWGYGPVAGANSSSTLTSPTETAWSN